MVKKINEFKELQKKKGKKGFSMIELIIVLAIMAILVALIGTQLIPYLEKSREKRDKTTLDTCKTALESVMADHEFDVKSKNYGADTTLSTILTDIGSTANDEFKTYSSIAVGDQPFKSAKAGSGSTVGNVKVTFDDKGVITKLKVGTLDLMDAVKATT